VTLSGARSATATTSSTGYYSFSGLGNGTYYVAPSAAGYSFGPPSLTVPVRGANVSGQNFTASVASATYTISGKVTRYNSTLPMVNWTVSLRKSGSVLARSTTTNALGYYSFSGVADGTYLVFPASCRGPSPGSTICRPLPPAQWVVVAGANVGNVNFGILYGSGAVRSAVVLEEEPE
jgi:hypothetical protein